MRTKDDPKEFEGREAAGDQQLDGERSAGRHAEAETAAETGGEV